MTGFVHDYDNSGVNRIFKNVDIKFFSIFELFYIKRNFLFYDTFTSETTLPGTKEKKMVLVTFYF